MSKKLKDYFVRRLELDDDRERRMYTTEVFTFMDRLEDKYTEYRNHGRGKEADGIKQFWYWIRERNRDKYPIPRHWQYKSLEEITDLMVMMQNNELDIAEQRYALILVPWNEFDKKPYAQQWSEWVVNVQNGYATQNWFKHNFPNIVQDKWLTMPGQNYVGPGNQLNRKALNALDMIASEHDRLYNQATKAQDIHDADALFMKRISDFSFSGGEWFKAMVANPAIGAKKFFEEKAGVWYGLQSEENIPKHYKNRTELLAILEQHEKDTAKKAKLKTDTDDIVKRLEAEYAKDPKQSTQTLINKLKTGAWSIENVTVKKMIEDKLAPPEKKYTLGDLVNDQINKTYLGTGEHSSITIEKGAAKKRPATEEPEETDYCELRPHHPPKHHVQSHEKLNDVPTGINTDIIL